MIGVIAAHTYQLAPTMSSTRHGAADTPLPRSDTTVIGTPSATGMLQASNSTRADQRGASTSAGVATVIAIRTRTLVRGGTLVTTARNIKHAARNRADTRQAAGM